jgi:sugar phosphate permease
MLSKFLDWMGPIPDSKNLITDKKLIMKQYRLWRIKMFWGLFIGYIVYYFTRANITYIAPSIMREFKITKTEFSIIPSVLFVVYSVGKFLSGILADRCNIRSFMAFGLIGSSTINLFFGFIPSLPVLTFLWGLNGGLQSMGYPPAAKGLVYWFSSSERATKWALWSTSHTIGASIIGVLVGFCIKLGNWRAAFYFPGIIGLITGIFLLNTLTDKPSSVGLPSIEVYRNDPLPVKEQNDLSYWKTLKKYVLGNPYIWALSIAYVFVYFVRWATMTWGTLFMVERGIPEHSAAFLLSIMPLVGSLGGVLSGLIADKFFNGRCSPIVNTYLVCLIFSLWGMYYFTRATTSWFIVGLFLALVGFFVAGPQTIVGGLQVSRITTPKSVSAACGFSGMFGYFGALLSMSGGGMLIDKYGWYGMFVACGVACVLAIVFVSLTWRREFVDKVTIKH